MRGSREEQVAELPERARAERLAVGHPVREDAVGTLLIDGTGRRAETQSGMDMMPVRFKQSDEGIEAGVERTLSKDIDHGWILRPAARGQTPQRPV